MRTMYQAKSRTRRILAIVLTTILYFLLLSLDAVKFFLHPKNLSLLGFGRFGFSAFTALMFLTVGSLVWLYARQRGVAQLLFYFSVAMMVTFAMETAAADPIDDLLSTVISNMGGALALASLAVLLLFFPRNYFSPPAATEDSPTKRSLRRRSYARTLLRVYVALLIALATVALFNILLKNAFALRLPRWFTALNSLYDILALTGILATVLTLYRHSLQLRERQQFRLLISGVILTVAPLFFLTVLPSLLHLPLLDSQFSSLTIVLFPLAFGYSILRYQVLVFDRYIRRIVTWIIGGIGLAVLCYLVVTLCNLFLPNRNLTYLILVAGLMAVLGPCMWWLAHVLTDRLFFSEIRYYRRHIQTPDLLTRETFDLQEASDLLTAAAINTFETQEVCLFVLEEETGFLQLSPPLAETEMQGGPDNPRGYLAKLLTGILQAGEQSMLNSLEAHASAIQRVETAKRPLFLSETGQSVQDQEEAHAGLSRYLSAAPSDRADPLLVPVRAQGKLIGLLVLGERGDHQRYSGPDFEVIHLILASFSPVLETARMYAQASRQAAILNNFYSASASLEKAYSSIEEVASTYAAAGADTMGAGAAIWLYDEKRLALHMIARVGQGPRLFSTEQITDLKELDWHDRFYDGTGPQSPAALAEPMPACLPQTSFPFAWIPLTKGTRHLGVFVLTFAGPHLFSQEEKRILSMFAGQCAAALENAQITIALRAAYERQKELDRLKDQFIMTASHELRTPLTAVQGYIELLHEYNEALPAETRAEFILKAQRGCDELVLMVGNIMDASHIEIDAEHLKLDSVSLSDSVQHVVEILDGVATREHRTLHIETAPDLWVMADGLRLRQVLLNLVGNALKYSPEGTDIHVGAVQDDDLLTVQVRDHGAGVPLEEQKRLFERFMRLERDINSPMRGAGLGLYISRQLIEAMGGHIWVESSGVPGEGSTFAFTLKRSRRTSELPSYAMT